MSFFKSLFVSPSEYTINSKDGSTTFIKDEYIHDKKSLEQLRQLVCPSISPQEATLKVLIRSAKSILDTTTRHADRAYSSALSATSPKKFFEHMGTVRQDCARMTEIENYVYYDSDVHIRRTLDERFQIEARHMIDRAYKCASEKAKPNEAIEKAYLEFQPFVAQLDEKSIQKLKSRFKKCIKK